MRFSGEPGRRTSFDRVPDWERDAYQTSAGGEVAHLISRHYDGAILTLCGYVVTDEAAVQIVEEATENTESWDGLHRCFHCQRYRRAMLREREEQEASG